MSVDLYKLIVKVQRICTRRGSVPRFDVLLGPRENLTQNLVKAICLRVKNLRPGVVIREHIPRRGWLNNCQTVDDQTNNSLPVNNPLNENNETQRYRMKFATLNVNHINGKKFEIQNLLDDTKADVLFLQETMRITNSTSWDLSFPQRRVYEQAKTSQIGERGIAVVVKNCFSSEKVGEDHPNWCFVRLFGHYLDQPIIVGSVYIPCGYGVSASQVLKDLAKTIKALNRKFPQTPIMCGGDWNKRVPDIRRWGISENLISSPFNLQFGFPVNRWPHWQRRCVGIDYFVSFNCNNSYGHKNFLYSETASVTTVASKWNISDHCVVLMQKEWIGKKNESLQANSDTRTIIDRRVLKNKHKEIADPEENYWAPLLELEMSSKEDVEELCNGIVGISHEIMDQEDIRKEVNMNSGLTKFTPYALKKVLEKKNSVHHRIINRAIGASPQLVEDLKQQHKNLQKQVKKHSKKVSIEKWCKVISKAAVDLRNPKDLGPSRAWRWVKACIRKGRSQQGKVVPVKDENNKLLTDPVQIGQRWARHYGALAADPLNHSQNKPHWEEEIPFEPHKTLSDGQKFVLNKEIEWVDLKKALMVAKTNKAAGSDEIPMEFFKAALFKPEDLDPLLEATYISPLGEVLLSLLNGMFDHGVIPDRWTEAMVVSIPKKGDLTLCDNYRGISLMDCGLKLMCIIVAKRLAKVFDVGEILIREQAGFRRKEETMSQVCALVEIAKRRLNRGMNSFVAFIDLKKAYDTVPHEALFVKMEKYGVDGKLMVWLRNLYYSSGLRIRCGNELSPRVALKRGLRQGCPISPILFDIFANDSLEAGRPYGIEVPGLQKRIPGLLFADDLAILGGTREDLSAGIQGFETWCNNWDMSVGIAKCGIMGFGQHSQDLATAFEDWPTLQGGVIPIVEKYTYLGCEIDYMLSVERAVSYRLSRGRRALGMVAPFLASRTISIGLKRIVLQAVLIPSMTYGGEWFGMNLKNSRQIQAIVNKALRLTIGNNMRSTQVPIKACMRELGIRPIHQTLSGKKARLFKKASELFTVLRDLKEHPVPSPKDYWSKEVRRWIKKQKTTCIDPDTEELELVPLDEVSARHVHEHMSRVSREKVLQKGTPFGEVKFLEWNLGLSRIWYKLNFNFPEFSMGSQTLIKLRIGSWWGAHRYAKLGFINPEYANKCPFCMSENTPETAQHMLFECAAWQYYRQGVISFLDSARKMAEEYVGEVGNNVNLDPYTYLCCGGTWNDKSILEWQESLELLSGEELTQDQKRVKEIGDSDVSQFTQFLGRVTQRRLKILAQLRSDNTTGQSPNGQDGAWTAHTQPVEGVG